MSEPIRAEGWRDVTRTVAPGMPVWPGDPQVEEQAVARIAEGSASNVTLFRLSSHTGTHVDPPKHFLDGGGGVDALDLDALCGPCRVVDVSGARGHITAEDLSELTEACEPRILLRTANSSRPADVFHEDYTALTPDAAEWLVRAGVRLVGVDGPSVEGFEGEGFPVHHTLLGAGVVLVEGLDLEGVKPGPYELVCAPVKWKDADGAPARVLLRTL